MTREPEDLPYMRRMSHGKLAVMNDTAKVFFVRSSLSSAEKEMNMKEKKTLWIAGIIAVIALMAGLWFVNRPKPETGAKAIVIEVADKEGTVTKFEGRTDAEFLTQAMDEFKSKGFEYKGETGQYGLFIKEINGIEASDADSAYWAIYVNGEYGMYGADQQPVADGDTYRFAYETY